VASDNVQRCPHRSLRPTMSTGQFGFSCNVESLSPAYACVLATGPRCLGQPPRIHQVPPIRGWREGLSHERVRPRSRPTGSRLTCRRRLRPRLRLGYWRRSRSVERTRPRGSRRPVRFVCPTYEKDRAEFARSAGLTIAESWWSWDCQTLQGAKRAFESSCLGRRRSRWRRHRSMTRTGAFCSFPPSVIHALPFLPQS